ncbi:MAG: PPC domain-containing protein [Longimicrobiales bacterium]|nr:PPC domain-containing protein [Longimicrobiales bacterium]
MSLHAEQGLRAGGREFGQLTSAEPVVEGQPGQAWAFHANVGQAVTIDLISDSFDSYLRVLGPGLGTLENDDGGDGIHSRLEVTFPENGACLIHASSLGGDTGIFPLRIR